MNKAKYIAEYNKNTKRRLFKVLIYISIISFILGVFYVAVISKSEQKMIKMSFDAFFESIKSNQLDSLNMFINNCFSNILVTILVWIFGISIVGIPISIFYLISKSFVLGFTISSLIYTYSFNGLVPSLLYCIPFFFNFVIIFILMFYAINFSKMLYLHLFKGSDFNLKKKTIVYTKVLLISVFLLFISALLSSYLLPILLKSFTNLFI